MVSYIDNKNGGITDLSSVAPSEMLNVWNAAKLTSKGGTVNTADGKNIYNLYIVQ